MPETDDAFASTEDAQLRDLDFEGNMDEPELEPAPAPQAQQPEPEPEPEYEELDPYQVAQEEQAALEWLQNLAEEDPLQAADVIAQLRTEQAMGALEQRLAPVLQRHNQAEASGELEQLRASVGDDVYEDHKAALADVVARNKDYFLDPTTRGERLAQVVKSLEYDRLAYENSPQAARDRDAAIQAQVRSEIDAERGSPDSFGSGAQPRDPATGKFVPRVRRTAHVEGGSQGQPPFRQPNVDPVIQEIDDYGDAHRGDIFGKRPGA